MSEDRPDAPPPAAAPTAGALLRQARQAQGMHIAVLATAIKVSPRKLEALENDRFDELPDATFTRALAQTVCRTLKIDPAPVLALLPRAPGHRLEHVGEGINAPFRERPGQAPTGDYWSMLGRPAVWGPLLLVLLAAAVYFLPPGVLSLPGGSPASAPAPAAAPAPVVAATTLPSSTSAPPAPEPPASAVIETVHSAPPVPLAAPEPAASAAPAETRSPAGVLQLRASAESWVQVVDAHGQMLLSRSLQPGETVGLDGVMPLKLTIGNAGATQVTLRGTPFELAGYTRDNVARLELK